MKIYYLTKDTSTRLGRAGASLRVVNHPTVDYGKVASAASTSTTSAYLLVGFDRTPTLQSYDAIVPPLSDTIIPVPASVADVQVVWPSDPTANVFSTATGILAILVGWQQCELVGETRSLDMFPLPGAVSQYNDWVDHYGGMWQPSKWTLVLDQSMGAIYRPAVRPLLAPSLVVTKTGVLVANTLTNFTGVASPANSASGKVLKRLIISASAAGLVVVGTVSLTVGSPGVAEVARVNFAAATPEPVVIDYGEGLDLAWFGDGGVWKYYASTAITVDLTAILG